jgi:hypothetical protein
VEPDGSGTRSGPIRSAESRPDSTGQNASEGCFEVEIEVEARAESSRKARCSGRNGDSNCHYACERHRSPFQVDA